MLLENFKLLSSTVGIDSQKQDFKYQLNNLKLTFNWIFDQKKMFDKINLNVKQLETKETITEDDIKTLSLLIDYLTPGTDYRFECDFMLKTLKKKLGTVSIEKISQKRMPLTDEQIVQKVNESSRLNEVHEVLIDLNLPKFIDLGKEARLSLVSQLIQSKKTYQTEQELIDRIDSIIEKLNRLLKSLNETGEKDKFFQLLEELKFPLFASLPIEMKDVIVNRLLLQKSPFRSVASLANSIEKTYRSLDIISSTINFENELENDLIKEI